MVGRPAGFQKNQLISAVSLQSLFDLGTDFVEVVFYVIHRAFAFTLRILA